MSEQVDNFPFTWEAAQNAKGYFQIRFKMKSLFLELASDEKRQQIIKEQLLVAKKAVEDAGFKVQPEEPLKTK